MAVADLSPVYVRTYEQNLRHLAQQGESRLRAWVKEVSAPDMHLWDTLASLTVAARTPGATTPEQAITLARRRSKPSGFDTSVLVDPDNIVRMLTDPTSDIAQAQAKAIRRKVDDIIISAALGATEAEDGTSTAFPSGQSIGSATQAFDFNFITGVQEEFMSNEVYPEDEKVFVIRPNGVKKLLQMSQATSSDYVNAKALATTGFVDKWMGFTWITSNLLPNVTGNQYYYLAMTRSAVGLHVAKDIWARVAEDPSKSFATRVYAAFNMGATRIEDAQVVRCHVLES